MDYPDRPARYPTHIPVVLTHAGQPQAGYIVDINAHGACLAGVADLQPDQSVTLRGAVETSVASVRWQANNRVGVHFERPLPPQYLAMLRLRGNAYYATPSRPELRAV